MMKNFTIDQDTKITLYLKECYGCDSSGKYAPLRQFIIDHQIKLTNFIVKRIELNFDWQKEAIDFNVELPLLVFENLDGDKMVVAYSEFLNQLDKYGGSAKPKRKAEGAVSVSRATDGITSQNNEVDDGEEKDN